VTDRQKDTMQRLRDELWKKSRLEPEPPIEHHGDVFTEVHGVTVKIGPRGGIELPSIRRYTDTLDAAVDAGGLFRRQRERDDANPTRAATFTTGHFNPRWDPRTELCIGDRTCPACRR
jgi:hypothetical protein